MSHCYSQGHPGFTARVVVLWIPKPFMALYPHKLLTIGDLTHLLRWNYGVDLELENVCFRADKDNGRKGKMGHRDGER